MQRQFISFSLLLGVLMMLTQCVPFNLQTARTTPKGEIAFGVESSALIGGERDISRVFPQAGLTARFGLSENVDMGIRAGFLTKPTVDVKYRYVGSNTSPFAVSTGLSVGGWARNDANGFFEATSHNVASYFISNRFALLSSVRGGVRVNGNEVNPLGMATLGFRVGDHWGVIAEGGVAFVGTDNNVMPTVSIGIFKGI